ncbi:hypothetical protein POM88_009282 [Heracleum sosnowskyi]|uniref:Uncharacterized protein n=1 Tax=Heracleum sosnowskyi TaxID=360622 RepID=A0AAD8J9Q0_9APIA|nr:hypothetical protein POM88_009282 [Heracleum sosnowskyi]
MEMDEGFAMISLNEEEQDGLIYEENVGELSEIDTRWCLVGRFLTDSSIDSQAMQHKMASLWRPGKEPRHRNHTIGSRWLRMGGVTPVSNTVADSGDNIVTKIDASTLTRGEKSGIVAYGNKQITSLVTGENQGAISDMAIRNTNMLFKNQESNLQDFSINSEVENTVFISEWPEKAKDGPRAWT